MCVSSQARISDLLPHQRSHSFLKSILKADIQQKNPGYKVVGTHERTCHNICCLVSSSHLIAEGAE